MVDDAWQAQTTLRHSSFRVVTQERPASAESQYDEEEKVTFIEDRSANGTFVNDERVGKGNKILLAHGDRVSFLKKKHGAFAACPCVCPCV